MPEGLIFVLWLFVPLAVVIAVCRCCLLIAQLKYGNATRLDALEATVNKLDAQLNSIDGEELQHLRSDVTGIKVQLGLNARRK